MNGVQIRPAVVPDEVEQIAALLAEEVRWHLTHWPADFGAAADGSEPGIREQLTDMASDPSVLLLVASVDGSVVGLISGSVQPKPAGGMVRYDGPVAYVADVIVSAEHRQRGIGAALMEAFEAWAVERGAATVRLYVHDGNDGAIGLYERHGYRRVHIEMRKDL